MKRTLIAFVLLLVGCRSYNEFYNPETFQALATKYSFVTNGNYVSNCGCSETKIRAIHTPTEVTGVLHFQQTDWYDKSGNINYNVQMFFVADEGMRDKYNKFLAGAKDTMVITPAERVKTQGSTDTYKFTLD